MTVASRVLRAQGSTSEQGLRDFAGDPSPQVRRQVAANTRTPADVVAHLVSDRDWRTRAAVAARPDLPTSGGVALVGDKTWQVRFAVADNRHNGPAVWRAIVRATRTDIRIVFAQNPWVPHDISELLCADFAKDVRQTLATCTSHRLVLDRLLADEHQDVRADALRNSLIADNDVVAAAGDRHPVVRAAAAHHPLLPLSERDRLLADRSSYVRDEASRPPRPSHSVRLEPASAGGGVGPDLTDPQVLASWPATPSKPRTKWLKLFPQYRPNQDEVPEHVVWFWRYSEKVDRDPAWRAWWTSGSASNLIIGIYPTPADDLSCCMTPTPYTSRQVHPTPSPS